MIESRVAEELKEMREMMRMMVVAQGNGVKACEMCNLPSHRTDECPSLQHDNMADVNAMGGYQQFNNQPTRYGLAANGYSWKQGGFPNQQQIQQQQPYQPPHQRQNYQNQPRRDYNQAGPSNANSNQGKSFEEFVKEQFKELFVTLGATNKKLDNHIEITGKQIGQLTADIAELKAEKGKLPSQTVPNPKCGVNAITLLSGQLLEDQKAEPEQQNLGTSSEDHAADPLFPYADLKAISENHNRSAYQNCPESAYVSETVPISHLPESPLPFPTQIKKLKQSTELDPDLLELFSKVELSIPLIDAIQQIPKYAKFLKELCTTRRRGSKVEQTLQKQSVAAIIPSEVIPKCEDRGMFIIPCIIGTKCRNNCMLDIGSAINVIPNSLYRTMQIGPLQSTNSIVQLANKSCARPEGIIIDVLVRIGELVFFADFYVLQDDIKESTDNSRIILGRPFMVTARIKTDSWTGEVSVEGNGRKVTLNGYHVLHDPPDTAGKHVAEVDGNATWDPNAVEKEKENPMQKKKLTKTKRYELNSIKVYVPPKSCPSVMQVPKFEWSPLQKHLNCKALVEEKKLSPFGKKGPDKEHKLDAPLFKT